MAVTFTCDAGLAQLGGHVSDRLNMFMRLRLWPDRLLIAPFGSAANAVRPVPSFMPETALSLERDTIEQLRGIRVVPSHADSAYSVGPVPGLAVHPVDLDTGGSPLVLFVAEDDAAPLAAGLEQLGWPIVIAEGYVLGLDDALALFREHAA